MQVVSAAGSVGHVEAGGLSAGAMSPPILEDVSKGKKKKVSKRSAEESAGAPSQLGKRPKTNAGETPRTPTGGAGAAGAAGAAGSSGKKKSVAGDAAWTMGKDPVKGRVMVATRDLTVGEIILIEKPLVAASWHEHRCLECHEPHASSTCKEVSNKYPKEVATKMEDIEQALGSIDGGWASCAHTPSEHLAPTGSL